MPLPEIACVFVAGITCRWRQFAITHRTSAPAYRRARVHRDDVGAPMTKAPRAGRPRGPPHRAQRFGHPPFPSRRVRSASVASSLGRLHAAAVDLVELVARHDDERYLHHGLRGFWPLIS